MAAQAYKGNALRKSSAFNSRAVVVMIALLLSVLLVLGGMMAAAPRAYGEIYPVDSDVAQTYDASENSQETSQFSEEAVEGEQISDDAVPMASGLGSSEIMAGDSIGFQWVIIAGIVAVVAFFAVSMRKTNSSITKMRNMMR